MCTFVGAARNPFAKEFVEAKLSTSFSNAFLVVPIIGCAALSDMPHPRRLATVSSGLRCVRFSSISRSRSTAPISPSTASRTWSCWHPPAPAIRAGAAARCAAFACTAGGRCHRGIASSHMRSSRRRRRLASSVVRSHPRPRRANRWPGSTHCGPRRTSPSGWLNQATPIAAFMRRPGCAVVVK
jgi:hypothetical protein